MIAEDERLARDELAYLIEQEEDCVLCGVAENGQELLQMVEGCKPDVIFVDIQMPHLSGMDAAKELLAVKLQRVRLRPLIVFTTAYDEYAIQAFSVEVTDYLLKPYDSKRFQETMARIRRTMAHASEGMGKNTGGPRISAKESINFDFQKLLIDDGDKVVLVPARDIQYAVRQDRLIEIHTEQECLQAKWTLQELEQKLHGLPFYRSHRSYLVNLNFVHEIIPWFNGAYTIVLNDKTKTKIPVSRSSARELFEILGQS